ncbi:MAG: DUF4111 domain-containing protein [Chloroflexi bacterium]|nr:DUF4111 domain-containing protein [Chloroflexota bacterium]
MTEKLNAILDLYADSLQRQLGDDLIGIYLTGSIALGGYHENKSDMDFTTLVRKPLPGNALPLIKNVHRDVRNRYPQSKLEGHYITMHELGKNPEEIEPVVTYHDGKLEKGYRGINMVTWFTLKKYGVTVWGLPVKELALDVTENNLLSYVSENVNSYWARWLLDTKKLFSPKGIYALTDKSIEWGVLGISRMVYTLSEKDVTSKDKVVTYALEHTPRNHHKILNEAHCIRTGNNRREYQSSLKRRKDMIEFMEYMIRTCNRLSARQQQG